MLIDDVESARDALKEYYSFYIGGMGARGKNFYNDLFTRYGYEAEAREIQELFLGGQQREAAAKVPDAFVDEVALVGSVERIADRLAAWRESGATTLLVSTRDAGDAARGRRSSGKTRPFVRSASWIDVARLDRRPSSGRGRLDTRFDAGLRADRLERGLRRAAARRARRSRRACPPRPARRG